MKKTHKLILLSFLVLLLYLPAFSQSLKIGANAPDFSLQLQQDGKASDKTVTLNSYKEKVLFFGKRFFQSLYRIKKMKKR